MNKITASLIIITISIIGLALFNNSSSAPRTSKFDTIKNDISSGAKLIDVRTPEEYSAEHIELSSNLNLVDIQNGVYSSVPKDTKIYVYCHSGNRSSQAAAILKSAGYTNITDLGGIESVASLGANKVK